MNTYYPAFCGAKSNDAPYTGHTNGERLYYACANRLKLGMKRSPCPWLKKDAIEKFILDNLKEVVLTRDTIRKGLEMLQVEEASNRREDDTEKIEVERQLAQAKLEISRCYAAIKRGVHAEAMSEPINELHERIKSLDKRLAEIEKEREKGLKLPAITNAMVDDILIKVHTLLDTAERKELKTALTQFIQRIEIQGQDVTIEYTFKKPSTVTGFTTGDPGGLRGLMQYLDYGFYPVNAPSTLITPHLWRGRISGAVWPELVKRHKVESLRKLAKEYNVSHEAIRRTLTAESSKN